MRRVFISSLILLLSFGLVVQDASARGFGGRGFAGRSFSMNRSRPAYSNTLHTKKSVNKSNQWRGALTGFMLGSLIGSLFMGHGLGSGLISWLLLGGALWFVVNVLKRRKFYQDKKQDRS